MGASAEELLQNVFGSMPLDLDLVRQAGEFHTVMLRTGEAQVRGQAAVDGRLVDHLAYIKESRQAKRARVEPVPAPPQPEV